MVKMKEKPDYYYGRYRLDSAESFLLNLLYYLDVQKRFPT